MCKVDLLYNFLSYKNSNNWKQIKKEKRYQYNVYLFKINKSHVENYFK